MQGKTGLIVGLLLVMAALVLCALVVSAEDKTAPVVVVPEDVPGADVIVFLGDTYDFDLTSCTDDVGIVSFKVEFKDAGTPVVLTSTTPHIYYTFTKYTQAWVTVRAFDATSKEGTGYFSIDVAEKVTSDITIDGVANYPVDHSLYLDDVDLSINNSKVSIAAGAGLGPGGGGGGAGVPEMLGESLTPSAGALSGHWEPYYWYSYWRTGSTQYGSPSLDTSTKMSGTSSIKVGGGTYQYGFEYHFNANVDLTKYNAITFYVHSNYNSYSQNMYYCYFYGSHDYSSTYGYAYLMAGSYYQGGFAAYNGWQAYTIPLDLKNVGYWYQYNCDLTNIACIRFYMYSISGTSYYRWIDNIGIYTANWADAMTESTSSSGDYGGYWSSAAGVGSSTAVKYVGKSSVYASIKSSGSYNDIYYYFNKPTDLSAFNGIRFFCTMQDSTGVQVQYSYYWPYTSYYNLYVYDSSGKYCYYYENPNHYTYYGSGWVWYAHSLPFGTAQSYSNTGIDMTKVSYIRLANIYMSYVYPGAYPYNFFIDGFEFYSQNKLMGGGGGGGFKPDNVPLAIYMKGGDLTMTGNSQLVGTAATGARLMVDGGSAYVRNATFNNMWYTEGTIVPNVLHSLGGLEVYGDADIAGVSFVGCNGPGLALFDGVYTLEKSTMDFTGTTLKVVGSPKLIIGLTSRTTKPTTIDLTGWTLRNSAAGTGALVAVSDCRARVTVKVHGNDFENNAYAGFAVSSARSNIDFEVQIYSQNVQSGGTGLIVSVTGPATSTTKKTSVSIWDCLITGMKIQGAAVYASDIDSTIAISLDNLTITRCGDLGLLLSLKNTKGAANIDLNEVQMNENTKEGAIVKFEGTTATNDVAVTGSTFKLNKAAGLSVLFATVTAVTGSSTSVSLSSTVLDGNSGAGFAIIMDDAIIEASARMSDVETMRNTGPGLSFGFAKVTGNVTLLLTDTSSHDNTGHGMYMKTSQEAARTLATFCTIKVDYDACSFEYNMGSGVVEEFSAISGAADEFRSGARLEVTGRDLKASSNQGDGYNIGPAGSPAYGTRDATYTFRDSDFSGNKRAGLYIKELYNNDALRGYAREYVDIFNCTLNTNANGLEQYWDRNSIGTETSVKVDRCTLKDNDVMAIYAHGYETAISGESMLQSAIYEIAGSFMDSLVTLDISGAHDLNGLVNPTLNVTMVNNTFRVDMPVTISLSGYYNCLRNPVMANIVYKHNTHLMASAADGLLIEMYGGTKLQASAIVEDAEFINPGGHGVKVAYGTTHNTAAQRKLAIVIVQMTDITVRNALYNGVELDENHANKVEAYTIGRYTITRLDVRDAVIGVRSESIDGEIHDSKFSRIIDNTINVKVGIIDVYDSDIGEITKENLVVDERSAIRLWYSLLLKVVWSTTGAPVIGASLEVRDNTWSIIGIDIIDGPDGVLFGNLNSVIVDFIGIVTRNPYIASIEFRGLQRDVTVNVTKRTDLTIYLVDDIAPRLSIESPRDGTMQRDHTVTVMGGAYDMHSGIDHVAASFDGETWHNATGGSVYECTLTDVPDGLNVVAVRAYDTSGNYAEASVVVLIDSTPPALIVISPVQDQRTRSGIIEVVGTTDVGASAYIDGVQIPVDYTLISHFVTLREGANAIKVTVADQLGNAREVIVDVFLDTQAPYLALLSPENGATVNTKDVRLLGLTETLDVAVRMGSTVIQTDAKGQFIVNLALVPGVNHIELVASDGVGNERHLPVVLTYDDIPPWLKIMEPLAGSIHNVNEVAVAGYVKDGTRVFINGRETSVVLGQFRTDIYAPEGGVDVEVVAVDEAGNELSTTVHILVDTTLPGIELTSPVDGMTTNVRTLGITGLITTEDNPKELELTINGLEFPVGLDRGIHQTIELLDGVNVITIEVVDLAGNVASVVRTVTFDASAPYLTFGFENTRVDPYMTDPVSLGTFVYVTGFTEVGATLTVNGAFVEVDHVTGRFNCTMELPAPQVGYKVSRTQVRIVATDAAGNVATQEGWANRLEGEVGEPVEVADDNGSLLMVFAMIILLLAVLMAVAYRYYDQRVERADRLEAEGAKEDTVVEEGEVD